MKSNGVVLIGAMMAATLLSTSCASTSTSVGLGQLPRELRGTWQGRVNRCTLPGDPDSDSRIIIGATKVEGYEDWSEVLEVAPLSRGPLAWKVKTRLHIPLEDASEITEIFLISGEDKGRLTIVNESQSNTYERCL